MSYKSGIKQGFDSDREPAFSVVSRLAHPSGLSSKTFAFVRLQ